MSEIDTQTMMGKGFVSIYAYNGVGVGDKVIVFEAKATYWNAGIEATELRWQCARWDDELWSDLYLNGGYRIAGFGLIVGRNEDKSGQYLVVINTDTRPEYDYGIPF